MEDVELDLRRDALDAIADKAIERKTGARGLRSILETVLLDTMYRVPSEPDVVKVVVDASVINGENEPLLVHEQQETKKASLRRGLNKAAQAAFFDCSVYCRSYSNSLSCACYVFAPCGCNCLRRPNI